MAKFLRDQNTTDATEQVRNAYGESRLSDTQIQEAIDVAERFIERRWETTVREESDAPDDDLERIALLLVQHVMQDKEPDVSSNSAQDKSVTFNVPQAKLDTWLKNTSEGRTLGTFLTAFGISPVTTSRTTPKTFR